MPLTRSTERRFGGRQGGRSNQGRQRQRNNLLQRPTAVRFDNEGEPIRQPYAPGSNEGLIREASTSIELPYDDQIALTVNEVTMGDHKVELSIHGSAEPVRDDRFDNERLPSQSELASQPYVSDRSGNTVKVRGLFPLGVAATLLFANPDGTHQAAVFRQPELETLKGQAGPSGPAQDMPGHEVAAEIAEEHFMIGYNKKTHQEVILAVKPTGMTDFQIQRRISSAKQHILDGYRQRLEVATTSHDRTAAHALAERVNYLTRHRPFLSIAPERLPEQLNQSLSSVTTKVNGHTETIKGAVHFDPKSKSFTVAQPISINLAKQGVELKEILDGTGRNRQLRMVTSSDRTLSAEIQQIVSNLGRPALVQGEDGQIIPPELLEARTFRYRYEVPTLPN